MPRCWREKPCLNKTIDTAWSTEMKNEQLRILPIHVITKLTSWLDPLIKSYFYIKARSSNFMEKNASMYFYYAIIISAIGYVSMNLLQLH